MDRAKIFKDYFVSSQNIVLIPNEDFGQRKFINVGINRSVSLSRIEELTKNHTVDMRSGEYWYLLCFVNLFIEWLLVSSIISLITNVFILN